MATVTVHELRQLIGKHTNWESEGWEPPERVLNIELKRGTESEEQVLEGELAGKTLSYEGREVTVVLDFDRNGYLVGIEFV